MCTIWKKQNVTLISSFSLLQYQIGCLHLGYDRILGTLPPVSETCNKSHVQPHDYITVIPWALMRSFGGDWVRRRPFLIKPTYGYN